MDTYVPNTTIKTQYGFDFLDRDGSVISTVTSYGKQAIVALFDQYDDESLWPDQAWSISEIWEKQVSLTTFSCIPHQYPRNPANGRFMRSSYREDQI